MSDFNKKFVIRASECHLGTSLSEETWDKDIIGIAEVENFLHSGDKLTLCAFVEEKNDRKRIKFVEQIANTGTKLVVFTKTAPTVLTEENIFSCLQITSVKGPPTLALYHTLTKVFTPLLTQGTPPEIQRHVANFQADLRSAILSTTNDADLTGSDPVSLHVVESIENEVEYWDNVSRSSKNRLTRSNAASFCEILKRISREFSILDALPLSEVEEILENAHGILDDLWRHEPAPYPPERITHLMDIIAADIKRCVSKQLSECDVWGDNYKTVAEVLLQCIAIGERWLESCKQLTQIYWPNYPSNMWKDEMYQPPDLMKLVERLQKILSVQTLLRQLTRLLNSQEQEELKTNEMFKPFKNLSILEFGQFSSNLWLKSCEQFERLLQPAEERVAAKLKKHLVDSDNPRQLLHEFTRYSELIARPILKQTLLSERQHLLNSLYDYVRHLQSQNTSENHLNVKYDTPQVVAEVIMTKQLEAKANEVLQTSEKLLQDLNGYENLKQIVSELLKDLKQQHTELFESWTREITSLIKKGILDLKESEPVVQFSQETKLMKVNYSDRLVTLIAEVRQFKALGYQVPNHIEETSEQAKKFMKLARTLEQIANFHNTIGSRMIICQRPMMLASALELSRLVQEEEVVSWKNTKSVEKYVETLKNAVEKLSKENNLLASYYYQIMDKIKYLEDVDLIKDYSKWKEAIRNMRNIMSQVEEKGFKNMQTWKADVDSNLCQVLEKQYLKSLDTLHLYLPEIYTDIVYRKSELQFSPDKTILMEKYQQQLKRFLDIPKSFRGVSESPDLAVFSEIIDRNQNQLEKVNKHTSELFEQLDNVLKHWQSWLQLDSLDVNKLSSWQHWDLHFRASKTFGQEIAKLPSTEERIGCFLIGLSRLRSDLESHNRSYWDQLVLSLKDSIAQDVVKLQNYVDPSTAVLTRQPVTVEEIGESGAAHANILKQAAEMEECYNQMVQKSQTLSSWTREQVDAVNRLKGAWERLQSLLENHQHIIAKQMETIKTTLNIESENLEKEMERFGAKWEQIKPKPHTGQISDQTLDELHKQLMSIKEKKVQWQELMDKKDKLFSDYDKFNIEKPQLELMEEIETDLRKEEDSWTLFEEFYNELETMTSEDWIVFRKKLYRFEDFLNNWQTKLKNTNNGNALQIKILHEIQKFEGIVGSLKYVRGEDFTEKHWMDVFNLLQMPLKPLDNLKFKDFLDVSDKLTDLVKELQVICKKAASEIVVRQALAELDQWDVQARFILTSHTDSRNKNIMLVKDFKEILSKIGDNQSLLQSVKNSADYDSYSERASLWENKLAMLDQNLSLLAQIQRKWVYLEPIFGGGTLIQEKSRFDKIDKDFHHVLVFIERDPRVSSLCRYQNLSVTLKNLEDQLNRCQKSLDSFLLEKRNKFPRFLFLGDDDLLEVVGQSSKEQVIQTHLKKLFAGINSIQFDNGGTKITGMCSLEGEIVPLSNPINITRPVEDWLNSLVKEMQSTLKELLVECLAEGQNADPLKYPSQVLCLADNITFTLKTEQAIANMTLPPLLAYYKAQLTHFSSLELTVSEDTVQNDESNILELKLKALLLDTIHHIDVLGELLDVNATKTTDWVWQKQLRFYSNSLGEITVKMANARMDYAYEYLGNMPKLVRTPLTDRCFLTLTQGMHLGMGGNPYGPAGTGKTESVKALGGLLGRQVLVFNCDEGIDASSMGRILSGLVRSGAWGCFDEFNRLDEATLSAVSMQIQPIQTALRTHQEKLILLEQEITVDKHCGIFVTLNPAGGSYGGRNKLPDNLKQLFRPVVMTHPDHEQIARTLLHCDGYQNADIIGQKLIAIFDSSGKLLSKQQHYDWGLRAIRTILTSCGRALKQYRKRTEEAEGNQLLTELSLVVKVLRMDTLSKLTFADSVKFDALITDVFKDVLIENMGNEVLVKALEESCRELKLAVNQRQIDKCVEFYEQLKQRMGVAIVGPPSSGKSTVRKLLFNALNKMDKVLKQHVFNPKSMHKTKLLGQIDLDTRQWYDGVLTLYSLQVTAESSDVWSWIVCDGNIDPEWVESLNSVLDDNRLLSLPSGWRVQFGPNVNFIFETHDLSHASPATISRMGIVLLSEQDLDLNCYIDNYVKAQPEEFERLLGSHIDYFLKSVNWICNEAETTIPTSKIAVARTGLSQLFGVKGKTEFSVALVNGLGQQLQYDFRELFAQQVYEWLGEVPPPIILKSRYNQERDIIDTYYTNPNVTLEVASRQVPLIPTGDVSKNLDYLRTWLLPGNEQHFLLIGPHGSAKSLILENLVKERSDMDMATIHCSANLTPGYVINKIAQLCLVVNTNKGKVYKPKKGNLVLYFKNLHLLKPDKWGTNIVVEFLNQMITYKAFFDSNLELVGYEGITIVGSLSITTTLSTRFTSIVHNYNISLPDQEDLAIILVAYLTVVVKESLGAWPKAKIVKLAATMIAIYDKIRSIFLITSYKHYDFSPHDLTNWCSSILRYKDTLSESENSLLEVVYYEALKQFGDKLVREEDRLKLDHILGEVFKAQWSSSNLKNVQNYFYVPSPQNSSTENSYLQKLNQEEWSTTVKKGIIQYGREGQDLDVLVNNELLQLTASVSKILSAPEGHTVLVGRAGIGRKSAVKIVSSLQSAHLIIPISGTQPQFNNDLKFAIQTAGFEGEQVYLLLEDHIFNEKLILSLVNILISAGEVANLYNAAEIESMISGLKDEASRENFEGNLMEFFTERVKKRLHVIACIDVDNDNLYDIFENCPAFLHKSMVIWKTEWCIETIRLIPNLLINKANESDAKNEVQPSPNFLKIFETIKEKMGAPARFIAMIKLYIEIFIDKKSAIISKQSKLQAGVDKLNEAGNLVATLKQKAAEQQNKLAEKQAKANTALDMISNTMKNANTHKEEMEVLKHKTEEENKQLMVRKKEIELELAEVEPLIQEARSAVGNIKSEALSEIRSLRAPPDVIRDILEGVLRLMGIQDTSWNSMKTFLAKRGVKEEIRSFDATRITPENRQAVERLMANKSDSFDPKSAKRASVAAAPLAAWVGANVKYAHVVEKIKPLEREQNKLQENLASAEAQLGELSAGLSDVDATVAKLKVQLSAYTKEAAEIEIDLNKARETLMVAEGLVFKLNDEYERWQQQLKDLSLEIEKLPENCSLAAAFITYLSDESEEGRRIILERWVKELAVESFSFEEFLSTEREHLQWQSEGLAYDQLSLQNAIIILKAKVTPLLIDPTSNAINWFKNHLKHRQIETVTQNNPKFNNNLELSVRFGKVLIIEEIEKVSSVLFPLLRNEFVYQGERKLINLNGKLIDYHNDFTMILSSRNEQLKVGADVNAIVSTMNFTVTHAGLTEQLLSCTIRQENPEMENKRKQLLRQREELQEKQYQLQNQLLEDLANSSGDILQNSNLLSSLNETKASSSAISSALEESLQIQKKLQTEYEIYKEISLFGSYLYFACNEFSKFNILYALSVSGFIRLFLTSLQTFQGMESTTESQKRHLFFTVYTYVSRGVLKTDRLTFALHLIQKLYSIPSDQWRHFLGNSVTGRNDPEDVPAWLPKQCVQNVQNLQASLPELYKKLQLEEPSLWKKFMISDSCEKELPPHCKISEFEKVLLVQALRPDRAYSAMSQCVLHTTGLRSIDPPVFDLTQIYKESTSFEPILILTVSGTDPSSEIRDLAPNEFEEVAMGEGQETKALASLEKTAQAGHWLILKNLHLVTSWLSILSQHLQNLKPHENFRLWLITEPNPSFNFVLAQSSLKIVYEAPQGLRNNLLRTFNSWGSRYVDKLQPTPGRIFFVLACVHAILQERRTYIPQGWSRWYEFSDTDLVTCVKLVEDLWQNQSPQVQWKFIYGLCCDAVYGGRIENIDDLGILKTYLRQYLVDEVLSHRWSPLGTKITLPSSSKFQEYVNALKQLPERDLPAFFGLPENIGRAWEKQTSNDVVAKLKTILLRKEVALKFEREFWHKSLAPFMLLWKKLNQGYDFVRMNLPNEEAGKSPIEAFVNEEFYHAINLVQKIHKSFTGLNRICKGSAVPDDCDLTIGNSLINFQVPKCWESLWEGPKDPNRYLRSVITKTANITKLRGLKSEQILQNPLNLSLYLHPSAFLASYKQEYSRLSKIPMDQLDLESSWKAPTHKNHIILSELLVEGGLFEGSVLKPCLPHSESINSAPNCYISWKAKKNVMDDDKYVNVALYYTSRREKQLTTLQVLCDSRDKDKWIQAGLAFYLEY
ncbi:cytoplasmic dynein 2 heavy chain 1 [Tribolium castaneum]|uniref:cytoplasmic dynein 2 heavy chain 1 n=1 Tax=Tribolium castaneum TaxID=7070 RepID=UPI0000D5799C|nr:PREDICTED: cytoplasmic dynein 2 heavy chain 1 [Tribolium castaneum]|eukprot:XP_015834463.1 PREDICTED: cytoplasmic dynein 2 heavy chain 1 [Tribolium castaneum]